VLVMSYNSPIKNNCRTPNDLEEAKGSTDEIEDVRDCNNTLNPPKRVRSNTLSPCIDSSAKKADSSILQSGEKGLPSTFNSTESLFQFSSPETGRLEAISSSVSVSLPIEKADEKAYYSSSRLSNSASARLLSDGYNSQQQTSHPEIPSIISDIHEIRLDQQQQQFNDDSLVHATFSDFNCQPKLVESSYVMTNAAEEKIFLVPSLIGADAKIGALVGENIGELCEPGTAPETHSEDEMQVQVSHVSQTVYRGAEFEIIAEPEAAEGTEYLHGANDSASAGASALGVCSLACESMDDSVVGVDGDVTHMSARARRASDAKAGFGAHATFQGKTLFREYSDGHYPDDDGDLVADAKDDPPALRGGAEGSQEGSQDGRMTYREVVTRTVDSSDSAGGYTAASSTTHQYSELRHRSGSYSSAVAVDNTAALMTSVTYSYSSATTTVASSTYSSSSSSSSSSHAPPEGHGSFYEPHRDRRDRDDRDHDHDRDRELGRDTDAEAVGDANADTGAPSSSARRSPHRGSRDRHYQGTTYVSTRDSSGGSSSSSSSSSYRRDGQDREGNYSSNVSSNNSNTRTSTYYRSTGGGRDSDDHHNRNRNRHHEYQRHDYHRHQDYYDRNHRVSGRRHSHDQRDERELRDGPRLGSAYHTYTDMHYRSGGTSRRDDDSTTITTTEESSSSTYSKTFVNSASFNNSPSNKIRTESTIAEYFRNRGRHCDRTHNSYSNNYAAEASESYQSGGGGYSNSNSNSNRESDRYDFASDGHSRSRRNAVDHWGGGGGRGGEKGGDHGRNVGVSAHWDGHQHRSRFPNGEPLRVRSRSPLSPARHRQYQHHHHSNNDRSSDYSNSNSNNIRWTSEASSGTGRNTYDGTGSSGGYGSTRNRDRDWDRNRDITYTGAPNHSFSNLPLEWWDRTEDCKIAKKMHTERIDNICDSREDLVLKTTLWKENTVMERNMFPCKNNAYYVSFNLFTFQQFFCLLFPF
jgi:hypothetical protein